MTRLVVLLVGLVLLAPASAEACSAWVLWTRYEDGSRSGPTGSRRMAQRAWQIEGATPSREDCSDNARQWADNLVARLSGPDTTTKAAQQPGGRWRVVSISSPVPGGGKSLSVTVDVFAAQCLPNTIDPRPKAARQ